MAKGEYDGKGNWKPAKDKPDIKEILDIIGEDPKIHKLHLLRDFIMMQNEKLAQANRKISKIEDICYRRYFCSEKYRRYFCSEKIKEILKVVDKK